MKRRPFFVIGSGIALTTALALASFSLASPADAELAPSGTTGSSSLDAGDTAAYLGSAGNFVVLAAAALTAPATDMRPGEIGAGAAMTFAATTYAPDAVQDTADTTSAIADLSAGYASLQSLVSTSPLPGGADLGAQTLTPGVYHSDAALADTGTLTFDAQGDPNAVFVIQSDAAINTTAATTMVLSGGADACNIYWVSAAATTLGAASQFDGNIVSAAAITVGAGSTVAGRTLSVTAAITFDADSITGCAPITVPITPAPTPPVASVS